MVPEVVILPILLPARSANQSAPSEPTVIPKGWLLGVGITNSVMAPVVVILPTLLALEKASVNQSAPSGPLVIPKGWLFAVGTANSVRMPAVVIRRILLALSVNQRAPSGPAVISAGALFRTKKSENAPAVVTRPMR